MTKLSALELVEGFPELVDENRVFVTDDGSGHVMKPEELFHKGFSNGGSSVWMKNGNEMPIFREAIDHY